MRKKFIAGNWKMYKTFEETLSFSEELKKSELPEDVKVGLMVPYPYLDYMVKAFKDTKVLIGAQNIHFESEGAFTGEVSCKMLKSLGVTHAIIGHSERRQYFCETDDSVNLKLKAAFKDGIFPIFCVGENLTQREENDAFPVVEKQIRKGLYEIPEEYGRNLTIAYEPVWAIGTGVNATKEEANEMCSFIRNLLADIYGKETADEIIIQYGGSVKPENSKELLSMEDIDGALVGGASLKADTFLSIINYKKL